MNCVEIMPRTSNGAPPVVPDFVYALNRWATLPKITVVSDSSASRNRVSTPEVTVAWRGSMNWRTVQISGVEPAFLISRPDSMKSA